MGATSRRRWARAALVVALLGSLQAFDSADAQPPTCNGRPATLTGATVYGTPQDDVIVGTEGGDYLEGVGGNDTICGLGGDDTIGPGLGDDYVDGGTGENTLLYWDEQDAAINVDLTKGSASGGEGSDELAIGTIRNVELNCSNPGDDTLVGDDQDNYFVAGSGADHVDGHGGDDEIYGTDPSVNRTDAICWDLDGDEDVLNGGEGDDSIFGDISGDVIDGGAGTDLIDGGDSRDECTNGERYVRCEVAAPPPPPPECRDGGDNDGDGAADSEDSGCAIPDDPSEAVERDPLCYDGYDNDGDGGIDYPEDYGCYSTEQNAETTCTGLCAPHLTIEYSPSRRAFIGYVSMAPVECTTRRRVVLERDDGTGYEVLGHDVTGLEGQWRRAWPPDDSAKFKAIARKRVFRSHGKRGRCAVMKSPVLDLP